MFAKCFKCTHLYQEKNFFEGQEGILLNLCSKLRIRTSAEAPLLSAGGTRRCLFERNEEELCFRSSWPFHMQISVTLLSMWRKQELIQAISNQTFNESTVKTHALVPSWLSSCDLFIIFSMELLHLITLLEGPHFKKWLSEARNLMVFKKMHLFNLRNRLLV